MPTITHIHIPIILYHTRKLVSVFLSQPEKNSPSFSLSFPGAEGEQHRGIPLTKHPPPPPQHSLTINPLPLFVPIKRKKKKKSEKKKSSPSPTIKEENPRREKRQKRKKKQKTLLLDRETGRSVRLCVSMRVRRLMRSPLVRYKLAIGERIRWQISLFFVGF